MVGVDFCELTCADSSGAGVLDRTVTIDPFEYLRDVLDRVSTHPAIRVAELTPAGWKSCLAVCK
ncbi:MAG: transposase domain-containing protein [Planctomycetota bacterium]